MFVNLEEVTEISFAPAMGVIYQQAESNNSLPIFKIVIGIWLAVGTVMAITLLCFHIRNRKLYLLATPVENEYIQKWKQSKNKSMMRNVEVKQSTEITSAITYGLFKPIILLPESIIEKNEQQLNFILTHELIHVKRFDILIKLLSTFALCLHWCNPLTWVLYIFLNRDIEITCDESVVNYFGESSKTDYALTLLEALEVNNKSAYFGISFSKIPIEERILSIMNIKKFSLKIIVITAIITTSAGVAAFARISPATGSIEEPIHVESIESDDIYYNGELVGTKYEPYGLNNYSFYTGYGLRVEDGSFDPSGRIVRLEESSTNEFAKRDIESFLQNSPHSIYARLARDEDSPYIYDVRESPESSSNIDLYSIYSTYEDHGLTCGIDTNKLYFNGKVVREFFDEKKPRERGAITDFLARTDKDGEIDVYVVRDFTQIDDNGNGKIIEIKER